MCYKENKTLSLYIYFFDVMKNGHIFPLKVSHFQHFTDSFLVEKWGTLERARKYVFKNLLNLDCQGSIRFGIFQVAYK